MTRLITARSAMTLAGQRWYHSGDDWAVQNPPRHQKFSRQFTFVAFQLIALTLTLPA
jgi:hypothetical protein